MEGLPRLDRALKKYQTHQTLKDWVNMNKDKSQILNALDLLFGNKGAHVIL